MQSGAVPLCGLTDFAINFQRPLGFGACGSVYPGKHLKTEREVAIKIMSPELPTMGMSSVEDVTTAIEHETSVFNHFLHGGDHHPHVVDMMGYFKGVGGEAASLGLESGGAVVEDHLHYFVMERLRGHSLQQEIERQGGLEEDLAKEITRSVCQGLAFMHEQGIVHRDVCPRNVLYTQPGAEAEHVKIIDFSHAGVLPEGFPRDGAWFDECVGTAGFVAPEVLTENVPYSTKCDVYSLGCTVHAMLANGKLPRRHPRIGIMTSLPRTVSPQAQSFIDATLRLDPEDRPTMTEVLNDPWLR